MKLIQKNVPSLRGQKSLVQADSGNFYIVSSVVEPLYMISETYIFSANEKGDITDWSEVWGVSPSQHNKVLTSLFCGVLTEEDFGDAYLDF